MSLTTAKKWFTPGLHNIGFYIAVVVWAGCIFNVGAQLTFQGKFTVLARTTVCEQPLNNRCDYMYRIRDDGGATFESNLTMFRGASADLVNGHRIEKSRWSLDYSVDGEQVVWPIGSRVLLLSIFGFVPFFVARVLTPHRPNART